MRYFLIMYNRDTGKSKIKAVFPADRRADAMAGRFAAEKSLRDCPEIEVVVLGAESEDELKRTHARYFDSPKEIVARAQVAHS